VLLFESSNSFFTGYDIFQEKSLQVIIKKYKKNTKITFNSLHKDKPAEGCIAGKKLKLQIIVYRFLAKKEEIEFVMQIAFSRVG